MISLYKVVASPGLFPGLLFLINLFKAKDDVMVAIPMTSSFAANL